MPDPSDLASRLRARIRAEGPLPFDAWMEACLYDEAGGFYARGVALGRRGAFATAPTLHPAFAAAVAGEARAAGLTRVCEVGPGDGTLAAALVAAGLEVVLVERAAGMRARQRDRLGDAARWVDSVAAVAPFDGLIVANEVLDALPVKLYAGEREIRVGLDGDGRFAPVPDLDGTRAVCPSLAPFAAALAGALAPRGRLLVVDYAAVPGDPRPAVRTYVAGQHGGSPFRAPGAQDLTADVDLDAVRGAIAGAGLRLVVDEPQPAWLRRHGATLPPIGERRDDDWRLARLLDDRLPFHVLVAGR